MSVSRASDRGSASYRGTAFVNVAYKGSALYIRLPSPDGGRVRRRTTCATPRQAAALLERIEALVACDVEPLWWPIQALFDGRVSIEGLATFLDPRSAGLATLKARLDSAQPASEIGMSAKPMFELVNEYAALPVHDGRAPGIVLHPRTVSQYVGHLRAAARAMPTLRDWSTAGIKTHLDGLARKPSRSGVRRGGAAVAPATHRRHLWALLVFGDFLVARQWQTTNPAEGVAPRSLRGTTRRKQVWLRHAEWVAILDRLNDGVAKDALSFMLATGAEPGTTSELTGDKVSPGGARAVLDTNRKGGAGRQRTVVVDAGFQATLARLAAVAGAGRVFPGCRVGMLSTALARVRTWLAAEGFARHALVYPYQLRHTWACESLESGALVHDVAAQLGHAKVSTTQDVYGPGRGDADRVVQARAAISTGSGGCDGLPGEEGESGLLSAASVSLDAECVHSLANRNCHGSTPSDRRMGPNSPALATGRVAAARREAGA